MNGVGLTSCAVFLCVVSIGLVGLVGLVGMVLNVWM
ncbi:hypothetical protein BMETH_277_2 [methanotrophic bacterial endosymbiont of Bathymodiolus sp.]|nr:hypothetical protein BMETH_277_2 [methanotrophic bacterial endosymbiont of Bathymodiolus sp.]